MAQLQERNGLTEKDNRDSKILKQDLVQAAPKQTLVQAVQKFVKQGGFSFLESTVDGVANLSPERKARREIFLNDSDKQKEREDLLQAIRLWLSVLETNAGTDEMANHCQKEIALASSMMKKKPEANAFFHPETGNSLPHSSAVLQKYRNGQSG